MWALAPAGSSFKLSHHQGTSLGNPQINRPSLSPLRLGILLSGRGSNFLAIAESIRAGRLPGAEIAVVISNVADAAGLTKAREMGLHTKVLVSHGRKREEHDADVVACLRANRV